MPPGARLAARNEDDGLLLYIKSVVQLASKDRSIFTSYFSLAKLHSTPRSIWGGTRGGHSLIWGGTGPPWPPLQSRHWLRHVTSPPRRVRSIAFFVTVCLSVRSHISKATRHNFTKFSKHITCGRIARSLSDDNAIRYVLSVCGSWMTSCFHIIGQI